MEIPTKAWRKLKNLRRKARQPLKMRVISSFPSISSTFPFSLFDWGFFFLLLSTANDRLGENRIK